MSKKFGTTLPIGGAIIQGKSSKLSSDAPIGKNAGIFDIGLILHTENVNNMATLYKNKNNTKVRIIDVNKHDQIDLKVLRKSFGALLFLPLLYIP